jgi:hypothetical protein
MSEISKPLKVQMPTAKEDKAITAAAKSDPNARPLTPKHLKVMVPMRALRSQTLATTSK